MQCQKSSHFDSNSSNMKIKGSRSNSNSSTSSNLSNMCSRDNHYKERQHFNNRAQGDAKQRVRRHPLCDDKYRGVRPQQRKRMQIWPSTRRQQQQQQADQEEAGRWPSKMATMAPIDVPRRLAIDRNNGAKETKEICKNIKA